MIDPARLTPAGALHLQREIAQGSMETLTKVGLPSAELEVALGRDSLWLFVRRTGIGGYALRTAYSASGLAIVEHHAGQDTLVIVCDSASQRSRSTP